MIKANIVYVESENGYKVYILDDNNKQIEIMPANGAYVNLDMARKRVIEKYGNHYIYFSVYNGKTNTVDEPSDKQRIEMLEIQVTKLIGLCQKLDSRLRNLENRHP